MTEIDKLISKIISAVQFGDFKYTEELLKGKGCINIYVFIHACKCSCWYVYIYIYMFTLY